MAKRKKLSLLAKEIDYGDSYKHYIPSTEAIEYIEIVKQIYGDSLENKTPVAHYMMFDELYVKAYSCIVAARGMAKSTFVQNLFFYTAIMGKLPTVGKIKFMIYVSDTIENGVRTMTEAMRFTYENSEFLKKYIPECKFNDTRWVLTNLDGESLVVRCYGAEAIPLTNKLYTDNGTITMKEVEVGDKIFGADGKLTTVIQKSKIFNKSMYRIKLLDGRYIDVTEDHINAIYEAVRKYNPDRIEYIPKNITTKELLQCNLKLTSGANRFFIKNCEPLEYTKKELPIDPYTLGLLIGDGQMKRSVLTCHKNDLETYIKNIPYNISKIQIQRQNTCSFTIKGLTNKIKDLNLYTVGNNKYIPSIYLCGSIEQRLSLLQGLMDTNGTIDTKNVSSYSSNSLQLLEDVKSLVLSLGGTAKISITKTKCKKNFIKLNMPMFRLRRKANRQKMNKRVFQPIISIESIDTVPTQCIAVDNSERQYITNDYFRTHNTGIRGAREQNERPSVAIIDDVLNDKNAVSPAKLRNIRNTVFKAIDFALHPTRRKMILIGTPFHDRCIVSQAVKSGNFSNLVLPICEKFPCEPEEFRGAWEDRFPYEAIKNMYNSAEKNSELMENEKEEEGLEEEGGLTIEGFMQEMMLQVDNDKLRILNYDKDFVEYNLTDLMANKVAYNFYITTDFATKDNEQGDLSSILIWAYDDNHNLYIVDGMCGHNLMTDNIDQLFEFVERYRPLEVGIETSGQQGGFISWLEREMIQRDIFFKIKEVPSTINKLVRFMVVVPKIQAGKFYRAKENKGYVWEEELREEINGVSKKGFTSEFDDVLDCVSQIQFINLTRPYYETILGDTQEEIDLVVQNSKRTQIYELNNNLDNIKRYKNSYII